MNVRKASMYHLATAQRSQRVLPPRPGQPRRSSLVHATSSTLTYIICTNPRSGSWLLSEGLAATSLAGNPREWFNILEEQQHRARWRMRNSTDLTYGAYIEQVRAASTTSNGISGIKLHYYQFEELPRRLDVIDNLGGLTSAQALASLFPALRLSDDDAT